MTSAGTRKDKRPMGAIGRSGKPARASRADNPGVQAEKEEPQPQVEVAFGLRMTNCEPSKPSV